jgi:hypothetical protein
VLLAGVLGGGDGDDLGEGHRWGVDARHAQSVPYQNLFHLISRY